MSEGFKNGGENGEGEYKKKFLNFYGDLIDIKLISRVSRAEKWNLKKEKIEYLIIFNDDPDGKSFLPVIVYPYDTEKERETYLSIIKEKLEELGINFI